MKYSILITLFVFFSGCALTQAPVEQDTGAAEPDEVYTVESWKKMISEDCQSFYDGCNTCNRTEGSEMLMCTLRYCPEEAYEKPYCLDDEVQADEDVVYNKDSWQKIISEDCHSFYDGCNTCSRMEESDMFACTERFCPEGAYEKPYCLDDEVQADGSVVYNIDSWKEIIPADCQSFTNGCNNCFRVEGTDGVACDRRFCEQFEKPVCLDE